MFCLQGPSNLYSPRFEDASNQIWSLVISNLKMFQLFMQYRWCTQVTRVRWPNSLNSIFYEYACYNYNLKENDVRFFCQHVYQQLSWSTIMYSYILKVKAPAQTCVLIGNKIPTINYKCIYTCTGLGWGGNL